MALAHVSASQVELFRRCKRAWFNRHVLKLKPLQTEAQLRGVEIHTEVEHYLRTGEIRDSKHTALVKIAAEFLPQGPQYTLLIESEFGAPIDAPPAEDRTDFKHGLETFPGGPKWVGWIDLLDITGMADGSCIPSVVDHKSTSDFRYCKTVEELQENLQLVCYAKHVFNLFPAIRTVEIGHVYLRTRGKPAGKEVFTVVTREHVEKKWAEYVETVREMVRTEAEFTKANDVEPTGAFSDPQECGAYGGCPYRAACGLETVFGASKEGGASKMKSSLREKLAALSNGGSAPATPAVVPAVVEAPPVVEAAPVGAVGVLPPDAPPRETTPADVAALAAETAPKAKRGRPKKAESVEAEAMRTAPPEVEASRVVQSNNLTSEAPTVAGKPRFRLVIGSSFTKGGEGAVPCEDWIAPMLEKAAELTNVDDIRLLSYGDCKSALAALIKMALKNNEVPHTLIIDTRLNGSDVVREVLGPHAYEVQVAWK